MRNNRFFGVPDGKKLDKRFYNLPDGTGVEKVGVDTFKVFSPMFPFKYKLEKKSLAKLIAEHEKVV